MRSCEILAGYVAPPHVGGLIMQYHDGGVTAGPHQAPEDHRQHPPPCDVSDQSNSPVVGGMSTTIGSGTCDQPCDSVLVCCYEESSTPGGLYQPPCNDVTGFDYKTLGITHV
jgi:hypothetical protein